MDRAWAGEDLRQETAEAQGWSDLEVEVRALLAGVAASNLVRRNRIGETALAAYAIARRLARQKQHANLLPHVETMKRLKQVRCEARKAGRCDAGSDADAAGDAETGVVATVWKGGRR